MGEAAVPAAPSAMLQGRLNCGVPLATPFAAGVLAAGAFAAVAAWAAVAKRVSTGSRPRFLYAVAAVGR